MNTSNSTTPLAVLVCIMLASSSYSDSKVDAANQKIAEALTSGNVQSVIASLPAIEDIWPQSIEQYFRSAESAARFLGGAGDDLAIQQSLDTLFAEVLAKRCPSDDDLVQATAYFDRKQEVVLYSFNFERMRYQKSHLLAVSRFLGEVRERRIPNYQNRGTSRPGQDILDEAGVFEASSLTNPVQIQAYEKANIDNIRDMQMNGLQLSLMRADRGVTFTLLGRCAQLRHEGKLDKEFANELANNAHLNEKEREMRDSFESDSEEWGR